MTENMKLGYNLYDLATKFRQRKSCFVDNGLQFIYGYPYWQT